MGEIILKGDQDWTIWFTKFGKGLLAIIIATFLTYVATFLQDNPLPDPKWQFIAGFLVIVFIQLGNLIKHA
jgi:hypothetical protein